MSEVVLLDLIHVRIKCKRTSIGIRVGIMQLETDAFDKVADIVCSPYVRRARFACWTPHSNSPSVRVVLRKLARLALFSREWNGGISIDNGPIYTHTLPECCRINKDPNMRIGRTVPKRTLTRVRSFVDMGVGGQDLEMGWTVTVTD